MRLSGNYRTFKQLYVRQLLATFFIIGFISCSKSDEDTPLDIVEYPNRSEDFSLWQLDAFFEEVQMGYIIRTDDKKLIVIDGGGKSTAPILERYLQQFGGKVDTWILTHPHADHVNALLGIIDNGSIIIERVLHVPIDEAWVQEHEARNADLVIRYNRMLLALDTDLISMRVGDRLSLGNGAAMEVFGGFNPSITTNAINNSSLAFKVTGKSKSILFLGDLGVEGGQEILKQYSPEQLKSDYVQMAHHGQAGVDRDFYEAVQADYALWPTPKWLWNNQLEGKAVNSGDFKTLIVRDWMEELGIQQNYVSGLEGNIQID